MQPPWNAHACDSAYAFVCALAYALELKHSASFSTSGLLTSASKSEPFSCLPGSDVLAADSEAERLASLESSCVFAPALGLKLQALSSDFVVSANYVCSVHST